MWRIGVASFTLAVAALIVFQGGYRNAYARPAPPINPNSNVGPFDFSNDFYAMNGIFVDPTNTVGINGPGPAAGGRVGILAPGHGGGFGFPNLPGQHNWVADPTNTDPTKTSAARILQTTGGFDRDANLIYYSIMGTINDDTFFTTGSDGMLDANGQRAFNLANQFRAFITPEQFVNNNGQMAFRPCGKTKEDPGTGGSPGGLNGATPCWVASPAPPNRRQDNVFETVNTYFCQNLLGLWKLIFNLYTAQAYAPQGINGVPQFASSNAQAVLQPLGNLNGLNLDGTPVIERLAEEDGLTALGYAQQFTMPNAPHKGAPRYVV